MKINLNEMNSGMILKAKSSDSSNYSSYPELDGENMLRNKLKGMMMFKKDVEGMRVSAGKINLIEMVNETESLFEQQQKKN